MTENELDYRGVLQAAAMSGMGSLFAPMSFDQCRLAGAWVGLAAYAALGTRREVGLRNIRLALGVSQVRANQILRRSCVNFGMTFAEFMHQRVATADEVREYVSDEGLEHITSGFEAGNGVIVLTAHLGNWEILGARAAQLHRLGVIARPMNNKLTQKFIDEPRLKHGLEVSTKWDDIRALLRILRSNSAIAILPDQYAGRRGVKLPMFGQPTKVWDSLPRMSLMSGAPIVPTFGIRQQPFISNGRIVAKISPGWHVHDSHDREAAILEGTKRLISEIENVVREYPEQWLWLHQRWRKRDGAAI